MYAFGTSEQWKQKLSEEESLSIAYLIRNDRTGYVCHSRSILVTSSRNWSFLLVQIIFENIRTPNAMSATDRTFLAEELQNSIMHCETRNGKRKKENTRHQSKQQAEARK
jgi:hypothetical protein